MDSRCQLDATQTRYVPDDGFFPFDSSLSSPSVSSTVTSNFSLLDTTSQRAAAFQASPASSNAASSFLPPSLCLPTDEWSGTTTETPTSQRLRGQCSPVGQDQQYSNKRIKQEKDAVVNYSALGRGRMGEEHLRKLQAMQNLGARLDMSPRVANSSYYASSPIPGFQDQQPKLQPNVNTNYRQQLPLNPASLDGNLMRQYAIQQAAIANQQQQRPLFMRGHPTNYVLAPQLQTQSQIGGQQTQAYSGSTPECTSPQSSTDSRRQQISLAAYTKCTEVMTLYIQEQSRRPDDNCVHFWRNLFRTYFAEGATQRWCLACYNNSSVGRHAQALFPMDHWKCNLCVTQPGRGFDASVDVLPRLFKIKYDSGLLEEFFFLDFPEERYVLPSGSVVLDYTRAVHESVYSEMRIIRSGRLRVVFNSSFKISSWEFCTKSHEEAVPRRNFLQQAHQLTNLLQEVDKSGADASLESLKSHCNAFTSAAKQLAIKLDAPSVNDLGFSKRYVRCLQVAEVVSSMKDLISFSRQSGLGPINCLAKFPMPRKRQLDGSSPQSSSITYAQHQHQQQQQQQQQQPSQPASMQKLPILFNQLPPEIQAQLQMQSQRQGLTSGTITESFKQNLSQQVGNLRQHQQQQQQLHQPHQHLQQAHVIPRHMPRSHSNQSLPGTPQSEMSDLRSSAS